MARFTVRVELHHPNWPTDYQTLHTAMLNGGFYNVIQDDNTKLFYELPPAEYNAEGNFTRETVLSAASEAANTTDKTFSILVSPSENRTWFGLKPI